MRVHIDSLQQASGSLTLRQSTIVMMLSEGRSSKQIAHELGLSCRTVDHHIAAAKRKAGANNVTALIAKALRQKWIS